MQVQNDRGQKISSPIGAVSVLVLLLISTLSSCVTINHGYTNKKGSIEVGIDGGYLQNSESKDTNSTFYRPFMKYGVSDDVAIGADVGVYAPNGNTTAANGVSLFGLKSFTLDRFDLSIGSGIDYYLNQGSSIISPSVSAAVSYDNDLVRPFIGMYLAGGIGEAYAGVDLNFLGIRPSIMAGAYRTTISSSLVGSSNSQVVYFIAPGISYVF